MRVLLTNNSLATRAGSELYVRDVAVELMRRGHRPVAYSTNLGEVAEELRGATIPVIGSLASLGEAPDIIHGHHHYETLAAMTWFSETPAIYYCHGWRPWEEAPLRFPHILRYVAVDEICRERLITEGAISPERIELILNFFDDKLFPSRSPLPSAPRLALAFGHAFDPATEIPVLRRACEQRGIELHTVGIASGNVESRPGHVLRRYDIVFAKARAAIEAMGVGAAVVLCSAGRLGPMVTMDNFQHLRRLNFGLRTLSRPLDPDLVASELERYDATDAAAVSKLVRENCKVEAAVDQIVNLYERVIAEWRRRAPGDSMETGRAVAGYLEQSAPRHKVTTAEHERWVQRCLAAERALADRESRAFQLTQDRSQWIAKAERAELSLKSGALALERERRSQEHQIATLTCSLQERENRLVALQHEVDSLRASASWRFMQGVLQNRLVRIVFGRIIEVVAKRAQPPGRSAPAAALEHRPRIDARA